MQRVTVNSIRLATFLMVTLAIASVAWGDENPAKSVLDNPSVCASFEALAEPGTESSRVDGVNSEELAVASSSKGAAIEGNGVEKGGRLGLTKNESPAFPAVRPCELEPVSCINNVDCELHCKTECGSRFAGECLGGDCFCYAKPE